MKCTSSILALAAVLTASVTAEDVANRELFFDFVNDAGASTATGGFWEQAPPVVASLLSRSSMDAVDTLSNVTGGDPVTGVYASTGFTSPLYPQYRQNDAWQVMSGAPVGTVVVPSLVITDTGASSPLVRTHPEVVGVACGDHTAGSTRTSGWWDSWGPCSNAAAWFVPSLVNVLTPNQAPNKPSGGRLSWAASTLTLAVGQGALPEPPASALEEVFAPPAPPKAAAALPLTLTLAGRANTTSRVAVNVHVVPSLQPPLRSEIQSLYGGLDATGRFPLSVTPGFVDVHWLAAPAGGAAPTAAQPNTVHVDVAVPAGSEDWLLYRAVDEPAWVSDVQVDTLGTDRAGADGASATVRRITVTVDGSGRAPGFSDHFTLAMTPNVTGVDGSGIIVAVDGSITVETLPPTPLSFTVQLTVLASVVAPDEASMFTSLVPEGNTSRILRVFNTGRLPIDYWLKVDSTNALVAPDNDAGWLIMNGAVDTFTREGWGVVQPYSEVRIPLDVVAPGNTTTRVARSTDLRFDLNAHYVGTDGVAAAQLDAAGAAGAVVEPSVDSLDTPTPSPVGSAVQLIIPVSLQVSLYTIWPQEAVFTLSPESTEVVIFELLNMAPIYNLELTIVKAQGSPEWLRILLPTADPTDGATRVRLTTDGRLGSLWLQGANVPGVTGQDFPNHLLEPGVYETAVEITSTVLPSSPGFANLATTPGLGSEVRTVPVTLNVVVGAAAPQTTELHPDRPLNPTYKIIANDAGPHQLELRLRDRYGHGPPVPTIPEVTLLSAAAASTAGVGDIDFVVQPVVGGIVTIDIIPKRVGRIAMEVSIDGAPVEGHVRSPIIVEVLPAQCSVAADGEDPTSAPHVLSADRLECLCSAGWERVNLGTPNASIALQEAATAGEVAPHSGILHGGVDCLQCREGYFKSVAGNTIRCAPCGDGKFSRADGTGCDDCPDEGVLCVAGNLQLVSGFWCESCLVEDDITETMLLAVAQRNAAAAAAAAANSTSRRLQVAEEDDPAAAQAALIAELTSAEVSTDTSFLACIPEEACVPDSNGTAVVCRTGHSGILCSECEEGWAKSNPQGLCSECWPSEASVSLSAVLFLVMFALVCYIALKKPSSGDNLTTALLRIASTWAQLASLLLTARLPPRSILDDVITVLGDVAGGVPLQSNPVQCTFGELVGFYTRFNLFLSLPFICLAMGLLLGTLYFLIRLITAPKAPKPVAGDDADSLQSARSDVDIDDTPGASAPALGAGEAVGEPIADSPGGPGGDEPAPRTGDRPTIQDLVSPAASPSPDTPNFGLRQQQVGDAPVEEGTPTLWAAVRQKASRATLVLLFLAHFAVTKACLLLLDVFDEPLFGAIRFRSDLRHGEFDEEFESSQSLATVGLIAFGIGLPLAAVALLWWYKYDLNRSFTRDTFGFLYLGYRLGPGTRLGAARAAAVLKEVKENDSWSKYRPRACGGAWQWLLGDDDEEYSDEEDGIGEVVQTHIGTTPGAAESKAGAMDDEEDEDGDPIPAGGVASKTGAIITEEEAAALGNTGYYSWEAIIVARKILMTTVSVTVRAPFTQSALMVMILTGSLCLHVSQMPYASMLLNSAETMALIVLWISAMSGVVLHEGGELGDDTAETVRALIVVSNILLMMYFTFIVIYAISAAVRRWAISQYRNLAMNFAKMGGQTGEGMSPLASWNKSAWGGSSLIGADSPAKKQAPGGAAAEVADDAGFHPSMLKDAPLAAAGAAAGAAGGEGKESEPTPIAEAKSPTNAAALIEEVMDDSAEEDEVVIPVKPLA